MNNMPDFGYYTDCFAGSLIPEKDWYPSVTRAAQILADYKRHYRVVGDTEPALCAMAEAVYTASQRKGIASTTLGSMSVHYRDTEQKQCYRAACQYLEIYRGVGS